jgi:hypothetical protein
MTDFMTRDGTQIFYKGWGCRATDRLQPRVTGALDCHVTGFAWTVHPIGAR